MEALLTPVVESGPRLTCASNFLEVSVDKRDAGLGSGRRSMDNSQPARRLPHSSAVEHTRVL